ncbi:MAG: thiamine-phosphate kinase [Candidatus Omnitrophota bacterium]
MQIKDIGEFGLIKRFQRKISLDSSVIKGSGDDCAVLKFNQDKYLLFSCDMIVEGVDFTKKDEPSLIGRKALAVSISDIAACAGTPLHAVVSMGLSKNTSLKFIDEFSKGLFDLARKFHINIVGGDISKAKELVIDVSILGEVRKKYLVLRNGARPGDIIFVTGSLGGSIRGKHLRFNPRIEEAHFLVKNFKIDSMIDISDGLAADLGHILDESRAGAIIYEKLIPVSKDAKNFKEALFMGEDFELLFTASRSEAKKIIQKRPLSFKPIGEIFDKRFGLRLVDKNGKEKIIQPKGFRHF